MVSNKEYEQALHNPDNIMIMHSSVNSFANSLDEDELKRCKLIALWETLKAWQPEKGGKFTALLYQRVQWECLKYLKHKNKNKEIQVDHIDLAILPDTPVYEILEDLPNDMQDIVYKRYVEGRTLREIGDCYGYSYETIRKRLKKASERMEMVYN